jgi:ribosome recycling factor
MTNSISQTKAQMERIVQVLEEDLRSLRPGRASAELVGDLPVSCYGSVSPLKQVASITTNEQGQLIVQAWDKSVMSAVETAIRASQLGFSVTNDGASLRLSLPALTEERRQELAKLVHQKSEATRVALRQIRTETHQQASRAKTAGELREDELNRLTKELNDTIDRFNDQVRVIAERKQQELLTI